MTAIDLSGNAPHQNTDRLDDGTIRLLDGVTASVISPIAYPSRKKRGQQVTVTVLHSATASTVISGRNRDGDAWLTLETLTESDNLSTAMKQIRAVTTITSGSVTVDLL